MDYKKYSVEDLAADDGFIQWANRNNPDAARFWNDFIEAHPEMTVKIAQARTLVFNLHRAEARHHRKEKIEILWEGIEDRIRHISDLPPGKPKRQLSFAYGFAAVLAIASASSAAWYVAHETMNIHAEAEYAAAPSEAHYIEEVNTSGSILRVRLSDGSAVALENNSRLKYRKSFAGELSRSVYLRGEAFFEVAKDADRPFFVHTGEVVTRVLGTSFRVRAPDDDTEVIVSVKTGKVSVYSIHSENGGQDTRTNAVVLQPNHQVTYLRNQYSFEKTLVPEPQILLPGVTQSDFNFDNATIKEVFRVLQKAYGIEIIFDEEVMNNCFITAPLASEPLFEKLKIICRTIGARFETIDAKVVVTSTGC
jgi:transmembrane sensor